MSAPGQIASSPIFTPKLVVCVGGTGKIVGLAYIRIAKLLGIDPQVSVVDFPQGLPGYTDVDTQVDDALEKEGLRNRIRTLPDRVADVPEPLKDVLGMDDWLANAIFTKEQQDTPPVKGANQEPQVGATVARWKVKEDGTKLAQSWVATHHNEIYFVAGLGGGTGAGFTPTLSRFTAAKSVGKTIHGVFLIPWQKIGDQGVGDAGQARNTRSLLEYLLNSRSNPYHHLMLIGSPPGVEQYDPARRKLPIPVHPTLFLAALYILLREKWGGTAFLSEKMIRMEVAQQGITLKEIEGPGGRNLFDMLVHSFRLQKVLEEIMQQAPDQRLSRLTVWPLGKPLSWDSTEWHLKNYASHVRLGYGEAWRNIRNRLSELIREEDERRTWIMDLASETKMLIDFDPRDVRSIGETQLVSYLREMAGDESHRKIELTQQGDAACREICFEIRNRAAQLILDKMQRRTR